MCHHPVKYHLVLMIFEVAAEMVQKEMQQTPRTTAAPRHRMEDRRDSWWQTLQTGGLHISMQQLSAGMRSRGINYPVQLWLKSDVSRLNHYNRYIHPPTSQKFHPSRTSAPQSTGQLRVRLPQSPSQEEQSSRCRDTGGRAIYPSGWPATSG